MSDSDRDPQHRSGNDGTPQLGSGSIIPDDLRARWQEIVDILTEMLAISATRITRMDDNASDVIVTAYLANSRFRTDAFETSSFADYFRTSRDPLHLQDMLHDARWQTSPELASGVQSYLGTPIFWTDGSLFGVLDLVHDEPRIFTQAEVRLVRQFCKTIEDHLEGVFASHQFDDSNISRPGSDLLSAKRYQLFVDHSADDFYVHNDQGQILDANMQACLSHGYLHDQFLQQNIADLVPTYTRQELLDIWARAQPGTDTIVHVQHRHHDGTVFPVEVHVSCIVVEGQKLFFTTARNIGERIKEEQAIKELNVELEQRVNERTSQLQETTQLLESVMDATPDLVFVKDLQGRYLFSNRAASDFLGLPPEDILGKRDADLFPQQASQDFEETDRLILEADESRAVEERILMNGVESVFQAIKGPFRGANGDLIGLIGISRNITEARQSELALQASEARWQFALDGSGDGVWDWNVETGYVYYSPQWIAMLGYEDTDVGNTTDDWSNRIHPDDLARCWQTIQDHFQQRTAFFTVEHRMRTKDGSWAWILDRGKVVEWDSTGNPRRVIGTHTDVTERRNTELRLEKINYSLHEAERIARIGSWTLDLTSGDFDCSPMLYVLNGVDPDDGILTIEDLERFLDPDGFKRIDNASEACISTGEAQELTVRYRRADGAWLTAEIRIQATRDASENIVGLSGTVQDITEREDTRAQISSLADNLPNAALYRIEVEGNGNFHLTYISASIQQIFGIAAHEIMDDHSIFLKAIHPEDRAGFLASLEGAFTGHGSLDSDFRLIRPDGQTVAIHSRSVARNINGASVRYGIMRDVTREREDAKALKTAKEAAEAAERAKSDFLAMMSHEIRTPLNTVIGMTRLTLQTEMAPKQRNYLEKIDLSAKTLLSIINDVLDFSKIEAGKLELEDTEFDLDSVLDSVSAVNATRAEEKGLEIAYAISPSVPRLMIGDPLRLGQVLTNLVSNAIKFTHSGEIVVSVEAEPSTGARTTVRFSVRDTGIGLDADQIGRLFHPFSQADTQTSRRYGGTGLGLAISRQLVEMMGGEIDVVSVPEEGSTFSFTVTIDVPVSSTDEASKKTASRKIRLNGRRVMIVDDNASAREILLDMVGGFGLNVTAVETGSEALDILKAASNDDDPYELVLMDWRMPVMDGLETARRIRSDSTLREMPAVLMVTAYGREEVIQRVEQLGLQGLLIKPITESVMFNTVLDILDHDKVEGHRRESKQTRPDQLLSKKTHSQLAGRHVLVVDDNALNREVARDFLLAADIDVDTAASGFEAIDLLARKDYDAVLMDVHMPEMDGLAATRQIRLHKQWANLPIIALTAQTQIEDRRASLRAGMTAHLTKPIDETALYGALIDVLYPVPTKASLEAQIENSPNPASAHQNGEHQQLFHSMEQRFGNHPDRILRVLRGFLRDFSDVKPRMDDLIQRQDFSGIASFAHLVKGSVGYLNATTQYRAAERLEHSARMEDAVAVNAQVITFTEGIQDLLMQVSNALETFDLTPKPQIQPAQKTTALIAELDRLFAGGDYRALDVLDQLAADLEGTSFSPQVDEIRNLFDDLELEGSRTALDHLRKAIAVTMSIEQQ